MVMTKSKAAISPAEYEAIEEAMYKNGYLAHEYVLPAKDTVTNVQCPLCGEKLNLYIRGQSYKIYCDTDNCVDISVRGL